MEGLGFTLGVGMESRTTVDTEDLLRVLNNVALGLDAFRGQRGDDAVKHFEAALSWTEPLLGFAHEFFTREGHASRVLLLRHEDTNR